jgi:hypothetical protein
MTTSYTPSETTKPLIKLKHQDYQRWKKFRKITVVQHQGVTNKFTSK